MSRVRKYRAKIVPNVLKTKSFKGLPRPNHMERFEVCEKDVSQMMPKMTGLPMCYNHDLADVVGKVTASYRNPKDNAWEIEYEIDGATKQGADQIDWIDKGHMKGVSLQHIWGKNEPLEVSICWKGMRPGSETYESVAASKISRLVHFDSNSGWYRQEPDPNAPIHVAASADLDLIEDLIIFDTMDQLAIAASEQPAASAPAPAVQSLDANPQSPAPAAAAAAAVVPALSEAEQMFKRYNDAKNMLQYNKGILGNADKQGILESMGALELEKAKEKARADELEAKLKAFEEKEAATRKELEDKLRKEQDEINASAKQKIGDFVQAFDQTPEAIEHANKVTASMTKDQLDFVMKLGDSVQASYQTAPPAFNVQVESAMNEFRNQQKLQQQQKQQQQQLMPLPRHQQQQQQNIMASTKPAALAIQSSYQPTKFGVPHNRPYQSMAIAAAKTKRATNFTVAGHYQPAAEHDAAELAADSMTWNEGAGNNFISSRITQDPDVQRKMHAIWDSTAPGDGMPTGCTNDYVNIRSLFSDSDSFRSAISYARANKPAMASRGMDENRSHLSGMTYD